jgi:hypothetical protein
MSYMSYMSYELFRRLLPDFDRALFEVLKKIRLPENQEALSFVIKSCA